MSQRKVQKFWVYGLSEQCEISFNLITPLRPYMSKFKEIVKTKIEKMTGIIKSKKGKHFWFMVCEYVNQAFFSFHVRLNGKRGLAVLTRFFYDI